ncbi:hypothetical protein A2U01_0117475, partial [Trifolium medium]|nr:hypothetical protein [Trifolium medium]
MPLKKTEKFKVSTPSWPRWTGIVATIGFAVQK